MSDDNTTTRRTLRLLDVSGIFHPLWRYHEAKGSPVGAAASETVSALRERASARGADYIVACCDSGRSFRHAIGLEWKAQHPEYLGYKGHRPERDPAMMAALDRVIAELDADGVPIFRAQGYEADDVIATVTAWAVAQGHDVEITTDDKDLMQLVRDPRETPREPRVSVVKRSGEVVGPAEVRAKFGVEPTQLGEYLAIVGDSSDHVPGVSGIGPKNAAAIIAKHGSYLAAVEKARAEADIVARGLAGDEYAPQFAPAARAKLIEGEAAFRFSLRLTELNFFAPLDFAAVTAPRTPKPPAHSDEWKAQRQRAANINAQIETEEEGAKESMSDENPTATTVIDTPIVIQPAAPPKVETPPASVAAPAPAATTSTALAVPKPATPKGSRTYEMELEPRNYDQAMLVAEHAYESRLFKDIASPAQAIMLFQLGRKFGLSAVDSLRMIHMIEGKPSMSAQLVVGLVLRSGFAEYFEIETLESTHATWVTKRRGARKEMRWTFSVDDAKAAKLGGFDKKENPGKFDPNSNWSKHPKVMCMWRAAVFLARAVYTDLVGGLYMPDELNDGEMEIDGNPPTFGDMAAA